MDGETYEQWVAGIDTETGSPKGRLRDDANALRFVEVTINGPEDLVAGRGAASGDLGGAGRRPGQGRRRDVGWVAQHATTRVGPRDRQVQVPVEQIEAAVIRHYTSRAGDPHRHLHLQINARVWAAGGWRGIHSVGIRDTIEAINGIGHAAVATDPQFRSVLAAHGLTLDPETSEIRELAPFVGAFSARAAQIRRNVDRYEAYWRREHPGEEPGPRLREAWDRRAWAEARPDKVVPTDGRSSWPAGTASCATSATATRPTRGVGRPGRAWINRDAAAELVVSSLGAKRSAWNTADIRGKTEVLLAQTYLLAEPAARAELAEDITARAAGRCIPLLAGPMCPSTSGA